MILICFNICRDDECLYSTRFQLSDNKVSIGLENKKLFKKLLVIECENCYFNFLETFSFSCQY